MKLSIVIPVYKVEGTVRRCLESIVSQEFRDWQIILLDDGSPDQSWRICKEFATRDPRIKFTRIRQNSGLSFIRNKGIEMARGEYITFVDSDDYLAPGTLKDLMQELAVHPDYDILEYPVYEHYPGRRQHLLQFERHAYTDMAEYWLCGRAYNHTYAWNKIYRRSLFRGINFPSGRNFEDVWTLPRLLKRCKLVATTNAGLYYYTDNPDGITRKASADDLTSQLEAHLKVIGDLYPELTKRKKLRNLDNEFAEYYEAVLNILLDLGDITEAPVGKLPFVGKDGTFPILPFKQTTKLKLLHLLGSKRLCQLHRLFRHSR